MHKEMMRKVWAFALMALVALAAAAPAFALTAPAAGDLGYNLYDIAANKILAGPIGMVLGIGSAVYGGFQAVAGKVVPAVGAFLGGIAVIKANDLISNGLGMTF